MLPEAVAAMSAALARTGNASSLHSAGRTAGRVVEESGESIAAGLGARPSEVVFTGGGAEVDNQAVKGIYRVRRAADPRRTRALVSATEHHAVLDAGEWLAHDQGAELELLAVDECGWVRPEMPRALNLPPGRRAPPGWPDRATCCWRWGPIWPWPGPRCGSPSGTPRHRRTWPRWCG
jgi:cysteine desulfurase